MGKLAEAIAEIDYQAEQDPVGKILHLERLELTTSELEEILTKVSERLPEVEKLYLGKNKLVGIPSAIGNLANLKFLDASDNSIETVHENLGKLGKLETLHLRNNKIQRLGEGIANLENLKAIDLSNNALSALPSGMKCAECLKTIALEGNQFVVFPSELLALKRLETIDLSKNELSDLPVGIGSYKHLKRLIVADNKLKVFNPEIGNLEKLQRLDLSGNELSAVTPEIVGLVNLTALLLDRNLFEAIPHDVLGLPSLKTLSFNDNRLSGLPSELHQLSSLFYVKLEGNQFVTFPTEMLALSNLRKVSLNRNQIHEIPEGIGSLTKLVELDLRENPLTAPTMIWLNENLGNKASFNRSSFQMNAKSERVLNKVYVSNSIFITGNQARTKASEIDAMLVPGPFYDAMGKVLNAQQVVYALLEEIPVHGVCENKAYYEGITKLLDPLLDSAVALGAKKDALQTMATALGNCPTPILDLMIQAYIGKYADVDAAGRPPEYEVILAREALEWEINKKLANAVDENGERIMPNLEKIEQVQGLVNAVFLLDANRMEHNKVKIDLRSPGPGRLPSKTATINFAFKQISPPLAIAFAKLVCSTDADGRLEVNVRDRYFLDSKKMERIVNRYKNAMGDTSAREILISNYKAQITAVLQQPENRILMEDPNSEYLKLDDQQALLGDKLYEVSDSEIEIVYSTFFSGTNGKN